MLTVAKLQEAAVLQEWLPPTGKGDIRRRFLFTAGWQSDLSQLPPARQVGLTWQPSQKGIVTTMVNDFVIGRPRAELIRPRGEGMEPPFERMWDPDDAVVEMRTKWTRTFGFFHKQNEFVALHLLHVDRLKKRADEPTKEQQKQRYKACAIQVDRLLKRLSPTEVDLRNVECLVTD